MCLLLITTEGVRRFRSVPARKNKVGKNSRGIFKVKKIILNICFLIILPVCLVLPIKAQLVGAEFTYQGSLKDGNVPANGNYEIKVEYFDAATGGTSLGSITYSSTPVVNGIFSLSLNGATNWMFPGRALWIETSVRLAGSSSPSTTLAPRERIASVPYSISSLLSADSQKLGGIEANQYVTTTGGASTFIQNGTTQQTGSFNLDGTGAAGTFNAATQFSIGGNRVLSAPGADNIFAGFQSGQANTIGASNSFFGVLAGGSNLNGNYNSFFGKSAGFGNLSGGANSFFGASSGQANSSGGNNAFFGDSSGLSNTIGSGNSMFGVGANVTVNNLTNATAIGFRAAVGQNNSLVLGGISGVNNSLTDTNIGIGTITPTQRLHVVGNGVFSGNLGIGSIAPTFKLQVVDSLNTGLRVQNGTAGGTIASFGGLGAFQIDTPALSGGRLTVLENGNVGLGTSTPGYKLHVVGQDIRLEGNAPSVFPRFSLNFTGGSVNEKRWQNYASPSALVFSALSDTDLSETIWLQVVRAGMTISGVNFPNGTVSINQLGAAGATALCRNASNQISSCSSSARYKNNINPFSSGLSLIRQLRPVTFNWKDGGMADMGLVAEEVNAVEPLLTSTNAKGEVEGVKYDRIGVVLVNAVKEQQAQIEAQQKQIEQQQAEIEALKALVCAGNKSAAICNPRN